MNPISGDPCPRPPLAAPVGTLPLRAHCVQFTAEKAAVIRTGWRETSCAARSGVRQLWVAGLADAARPPTGTARAAALNGCLMSVVTDVQSNCPLPKRPPHRCKSTRPARSTCSRNCFYSERRVISKVPQWLHSQTTRRLGPVLISVSLVLSRQWACARRYGQ